MKSAMVSTAAVLAFGFLQWKKMLGLVSLHAHCNCSHCVAAVVTRLFLLIPCHLSVSPSAGLCGLQWQQDLCAVL